MRWAPVVAVALPGLVLAGLGLAHPSFLAPSTATAWWQLHIPLILCFPLLAVPLWVLLRGERGVLAWAARLAGYVYACLYTALDTISGVAAGVVTERLGGSQAVLDLFAVGDPLGQVGVGFLMAGSVLAGVVLARRDGLRVLPGTALLLVAGYGFATFHIFSPYGVLAMLGYAAGFALLAAARRPAAAVAAARPQAADPVG